MTISVRITASTTAQVSSAARLSVFPTDLGWIGFVVDRRHVVALTFGHKSPAGVRQHLSQRIALPFEQPDTNWSDDLRNRLEQYAAGTRVDFSDVELEHARRSTFHQSVIAATRAIDYGCTASYGELARNAGFPGAARAVGRVMAMNPVPLIVPCHRVIAAGGKLGGYSARSGISMKQHLLEMEQATTSKHRPYFSLK